jgi:hypothetical protein
MKLKNYILAGVCLFVCSYSFAEDRRYTTFKERTDNWLTDVPKNDAPENESGNGGRINGNPSNDPTVTPVGEALPFCLLFAGVYVLLLQRRRNRRAVLG